MFELPGGWQSFLIRDPAGNSILSGSGRRVVDLSHVPEGRYSLTSGEGSQRYILIVDDRLPGRALSVELLGNGRVSFRFGDQTDGGPYRVSVIAADGGVASSFYAYGQSAQIDLGGPGAFQVEVAQPGEAGFRYSIATDSNGAITSIDGIGVADRADWFADVISFARKSDDRGFGSGIAQFSFAAASTSPNHDFFILQLRDKQTGTISTYLTEEQMQSVALAPGEFEWRVFSLPQPTSAYPDLLTGLAAIQNGWTPYVHRSAESSSPFRLPEGWTEFVLSDPAGNVVSTGSGSELAFFDSVPDGRYTLTRDGSGTRYQVVIDGAIEGRVLAGRIDGGNTLVFQFGAQSTSDPYYVSLLNQDGQAAQGFYIYGQVGAIALASAGEWTLSISKPSEQGFSVPIVSGPNGTIQAIDEIGLAAAQDWFAGVVEQASKTTRFTHNTGPAEFGFAPPAGAPDNTYFVIQLRDRQTGTISTWSSASREFSTSLDAGAFEWRVLSFPQPVQLTQGSLGALNAIEGGWSDFIQRQLGTEPAKALATPDIWTDYVLRDPSGTIVSSAVGEPWIDLTGLGDGRYTLTGTLASGAKQVRSVVIDPSLTGDALSIEAKGNGSVQFTLEAAASQPFYVQALNAAREVISAGYIYGGNFDLSLPEGSSFVRIARPSENSVELDFELKGGKPTSINGVSTLSVAEWDPDSIDIASVLGPITANSGTVALSYFSDVHERYLVQIRDPSTGNIGTYFSDDEVFQLNLGPGKFEWRAIALPDDAFDDPDLITRANALIAGGWTAFTQTLTPSSVDYVLGLEPDQVVRASQLKFNYPTDAIKLDDGSVIVTNTYAATVERIYPDGRVERLAGGNAEGYVSEGFGAEVLLRAPAQLFDVGDGTILFADTRNFVLREINLTTGFVRTVYGDPSETYPNIPSRDLVGVGDLYDIGHDHEGRLYLTTAGSRLQGDQIISDGLSYVLRRRDDGSWYAWEFDRTGIDDQAKVVDMIFASGTVYMLIHDGNDGKLFRQYTPDGELLFDAPIGLAFGGGLVLDPLSNDVLIGDHTLLKRFDPDTGQITVEDFPITFANISFMSVSGNTLVITDSDRAQVHEFDLTTRSINVTYGAENSVSSVITDLEVIGDQLLMLDNQTPRILGYRNNAITIIAGNGEQTRSQEGIPARETGLFFPNAVAADANGILYYVESNHRIMKIGSDGNVTAFAGSLSYGYSGDGGNRTDALFQSIYGLDFAPEGSLLVADSYNNVIRRIAPDGTVSTLVGNGAAGMSNIAKGLEGSLNNPNRVLATADGRILIADSWNNRVVELKRDGSLVTIAGIGTKQNYQGLGGFSGDGGLATDAELNTPVGLALYAGDGTLYIADSFNNRIRFVDAAGDIHTLVGDARGYEAGQLLNLPLDVALVGDDLYVADTGNALVLKLAGVDRTGNDTEGALRLSAAMERGGFTERSEYADLSDPDFYDLADMDGQTISIRADASGLRVRRYDPVGALLSESVLQAGQSLAIAAADTAFLSVDGVDHAKRAYNLSVSAGATSSIFRSILAAPGGMEFVVAGDGNADAGMEDRFGAAPFGRDDNASWLGTAWPGQRGARSDDPSPGAGPDLDLGRLALMRQSLAGFGAIGGLLDPFDIMPDRQQADFFA